MIKDIINGINVWHLFDINKNEFRIIEVPPYKNIQERADTLNEIENCNKNIIYYQDMQKEQRLTIESKRKYINEFSKSQRNSIFGFVFWTLVPIIMTIIFLNSPYFKEIVHYKFISKCIIGAGLLFTTGTSPFYIISFNNTKKIKNEFKIDIKNCENLIKKLDDQIKKEKEKLEETEARLKELEKDKNLEEITTDEIIHLDTQNNSKDIFEELYQQSLEETQKNNLTNPKTRRRVRNDRSNS